MGIRFKGGFALLNRVWGQFASTHHGSRQCTGFRDQLACSGLHYRHVHHEPTLTSRDRALFRGEPIKIGGKALVLKAGDRLVLLVIRASCKIDSKRPFRQS